MMMNIVCNIQSMGSALARLYCAQPGRDGDGVTGLMPGRLTIVWTHLRLRRSEALDIVYFEMASPTRTCLFCLLPSSFIPSPTHKYLPEPSPGAFSQQPPLSSENPPPLILSSSISRRVLISTLYLFTPKYHTSNLCHDDARQPAPHQLAGSTARICRSQVFVFWKERPC